MANSLSHLDLGGNRYSVSDNTVIGTVLMVLALHALIGVGLVYLKTMSIPPTKVTPPIEVSFIESQPIESPVETPAETAGEPEPVPEPTPEPVKPSTPIRTEPVRTEPVKPPVQTPIQNQAKQPQTEIPQINQQEIVQQQQIIQQQEQARQAELARQAAIAEQARQAEIARQAEQARQAAATQASQARSQPQGGGSPTARVSLPSSNGIWQRQPRINFPDNLAEQIAKDGLESVSVRVEFDHNGNVTGCSTTKSSGNNRVDNFVCQRVRAAKVRPPVSNGVAAGGDAPFTINLNVSR